MPSNGKGMQSYSARDHWLKLLALFATLLLVACDGTQESPSAPEPGGLVFPVPGPIGALRMVTLDELRVEGSIGSTAIRFTRRTLGGGREVWDSSAFSLPGPGSHALQIRWFETTGTEDLLLADFEVMLDESSARNIAIPEDRYNYNHDQDNDGISNIAEIRNDSNPFDGNSPNSPRNDQGRVNVLVSVPAGILAAPFVVPNQLEAEVTYLSGDVISVTFPLTRNGNNWTGEFASRPSNEDFSVFWYEQFGAERIPLGFSLERPGENADENGSVRDENLVFVETDADFDNDGRSNLRERATGTNPVESDPASLYNANQTACATTDFGRQASGDSNVELIAAQPLALVERGSSGLVSISPEDNTAFAQLTFAVRESGTLQIEHLAGPPNDSVIEIWERQLDGTLRLIERADDQPNGVLRANLERELTPGGYCVLVVGFRRGNTGPLRPFGESSDGVPTVELQAEYR